MLTSRKTRARKKWIGKKGGNASGLALRGLPKRSKTQKFRYGTESPSNKYRLSISLALKSRSSYYLREKGLLKPKPLSNRLSDDSVKTGDGITLRTLTKSCFVY